MQKINSFILKNLTSFKVLIWILCLIPLGTLVFKGFQQDLGANPVEFITRFTGKYSLIILCVTLAVTPIRQLLKLNSLVRVRRILGLFSFFYALLHFTIWFWLDHNFDFSDMIKDVVKRPFITVGFIAFVLLIVLAATSFNKAIKYFGRNWQKIHYAIYPVAVLAIVHYYWIKSSKNNLSDVYMYTIIIFSLLSYRVIKKIKK
jgi:methionine sulfoxide reductase heme-binding subunit